MLEIVLECISSRTVGQKKFESILHVFEEETDDKVIKKETAPVVVETEYAMVPGTKYTLSITGVFPGAFSTLQKCNCDLLYIYCEDGLNAVDRFKISNEENK